MGLCPSSGGHVHSSLTINHEKARAEGEDGVLCLQLTMVLVVNNSELV
jgi:hypothetical protein